MSTSKDESIMEGFMIWPIELEKKLMALQAERLATNEQNVVWDT